MLLSLSSLQVTSLSDQTLSAFSVITEFQNEMNLEDWKSLLDNQRMQKNKKSDVCWSSAILDTRDQTLHSLCRSLTADDTWSQQPIRGWYWQLSGQTEARKLATAQFSNMPHIAWLCRLRAKFPAGEVQGVSKTQVAIFRKYSTLAFWDFYVCINKTIYIFSKAWLVWFCTIRLQTNWFMYFSFIANKFRQQWEY